MGVCCYNLYSHCQEPVLGSTPHAHDHRVKSNRTNYCANWSRGFHADLGFCMASCSYIYYVYVCMYVYISCQDGSAAVFVDFTKLLFASCNHIDRGAAGEQSVKWQGRSVPHRHVAKSSYH